MNPLSKKNRIVSFLMMIFIFFVVSPLILAYSLGYRFDDELSWIETGGIYIHANVSNTEVYLEGKFIENNGVLLRNTLIQNLRPDTSYKIEVHKEGLHSWIKTLYVQPSLVTEGTLMMLPKEIEKTKIYPYQDSDGNGTTTKPIVEKNTTKISPKEDSLMLKTEEYRNLEILFNPELATTSASDSSNKKIPNKDSELIILPEEKEDIPEYFIEIGIEDPSLLDNLIETGDEVMWLEDNQIVLYWVGKSEEIPYYYCLFQECRDKITLTWDNPIEKFTLFPGRGDVWVVLSSDGIWAVEIDDRSERNIQPIYLGKDLDFIINDQNNIVVLDQDIFYELNL